MTISNAVSGVTLWRRIADAIESRITEGTYAAGERLPGETEIAQNYGVNRHTVRRALSTLAERGLVRAEQGSGTFVEAPRLAYPLRSRTRFSEIVGAGGREPLGHLIAASTELASREIARRLDIKTGVRLVRIETLRLADRTPICIATTWCAADRFPEAGAVYQRVRSMTRMLAHHGVQDYSRASTRVTAAPVDPADAAHLNLTLGRPVLVVNSTDVDAGRRALLTTRTRFAADRIEFVVDSAG